MNNEYPKALYRNGEMRQVDNFDQEDGTRNEGFKDWHADHSAHNAPEQMDIDQDPIPTAADPDPSLPPVPAKRGPKPKAK